MPAESHVEGSVWIGLPPCCPGCPCGSYDDYIAAGGEELYGEDRGEDPNSPWCECHLSNGFVCSGYVDHFQRGYCVVCGHERSCHN